MIGGSRNNRLSKCNPSISHISFHKKLRDFLLSILSELLSFSCKANTAAVSDLGIQRESLIMGKFENVKMLVVGRKMMFPQESRLAQL